MSVNMNVSMHSTYLFSKTLMKQNLNIQFLFCIIFKHINIKERNIKNRAYYFFDDMINIKNFDSDLLRIDRKSYRYIDIYYIGCITKNDFEYVNIHRVNSLYFIVDKVDGFIEEKEGNKYLNFASKITTKKC